MILVGLSGKIGSGKSTVARRLGELGARVIDADAIAHEVLEEADAKAAIVSRFGPDMLGVDGRVQRWVLAERVFGPTPAHAAALRDLEAIVHPRVHHRIDQSLDEVRAGERKPGGRETVVVLDVPLLVRAGWAQVCDVVVRLECDEAVRRERLAQRNVSPEQQAAREAAWRGTAADAPAAFPPGIPTQKVATVDTSGDLEYTFLQVDRIWSEILSR
jgi:dephospho-CoA kinase